MDAVGNVCSISSLDCKNAMLALFAAVSYIALKLDLLDRKLEKDFLFLQFDAYVYNKHKPIDSVGVVIRVFLYIWGRQKSVITRKATAKCLSLKGMSGNCLLFLS